jgi:hypothetical protein
MAAAGEAFWRGMVPLPKPILHFWNSNFLDPFRPLEAWLALPLAGLCILFFRPSPSALALFLSGTLALGLIPYALWTGQVRHHGHFFLIFLAAWWMAREEGPRDRTNEGWRRALAVTILLIHLLAGLWAVTAEWRAPFSASREAYEFLVQKGWAGHDWIGDPDWETSPLAAWSGKKLFYPVTGEEGRFVISHNRRKDPRVEGLLGVLRERERRTGRPAILILAYPLPPGTPEVVLEGRFERSIETSERYYLYRRAEGEGPRP